MPTISKVYFGSAHVAWADAAASLPAKLQRILNKVDLKRGISFPGA